MRKSVLRRLGHQFLRVSARAFGRARINCYSVPLSTQRVGLCSWKLDPVFLARGKYPRAGVLDQCGQATKGVWGMSWRQEAMKGVEDCDKPGGVVKRALIPGCPNVRELNP